MKKLWLLSVLLLTGCSSAYLVHNWKNPDIVLFDASRVLIVGMTHNEKARQDFESKLQKEFQKRDVEAIRSIDLFDIQFTTAEKSEAELSEFETELLNKDFDAILFTKIVGSENKKKFRDRMADFEKYYTVFKDDYLIHQGIYYDDAYYDTFTVYHAETSLYCICVGKERQLIWTGAIDITDPVDIEKTVDDYVKLVVIALEEQDLVFRKDREDEITGL